MKLSELAKREDFRVGPLLVSPARRHVQMPASSVHLEPLVMQVFLLLLDARGQVVTRTDLFEKVWGGAMVGDDSINRAISGVRRIDAELGPGLFEVETIPRTGYRLTGTAVGIPQKALPAETSREDGGRFIDRRVLLGTGAAAAAVAGFGFWSIDRNKSGAQFTVLMDRSEGAFRNGSAFDGDTTLRTLEQAVALNPKSAKAWGLIAYLKASRSDSAPPELAAAMVGEAEQAARKALAIDPKESNALTAQACIQGSIDGWAKFDDKLQRVLAIDPDNARTLSQLVAVRQLTGMTQESWEFNQRALALEPLSPAHNHRKALKLWIMGKVSESYSVIDRATDLWPKNAGVWNARLIILAFTDRPKAALAMLDSNPALLGTADAVSVWRIALEALNDRTPAKIAKARDACIAGAGRAPGLAAHGAMILAGLGATDAAFNIANGFLLSRGDVLVRPQSGSRRQWLSNPAWKWTQWLFTPPASAMRADPRFDTLCEGIGLKEYWRVRGVRPDYLKSLT